MASQWIQGSDIIDSKWGVIWEKNWDKISIRVDPNDLRRMNYIFRDTPKKIPVILNRAINRIAAQAKVKVRRDIAQLITLKQKDIGRKIRLKKSSQSTLQAKIGISGWQFEVDKFRGRRLKRGASWQIFRQGSRETQLYKLDVPIFWGHGIHNYIFSSSTPGEFEGIFEREEDRRYPIWRKMGPSLSQVFTGAAGLAQKTLAETSHNLAARIRHEIKFELEKRKKQPTLF